MMKYLVDLIILIISVPVMIFWGLLMVFESILDVIKSLNKIFNRNIFTVIQMYLLVISPLLSLFAAKDYLLYFIVLTSYNVSAFCLHWFRGWKIYPIKYVLNQGSAIIGLIMYWSK